MSVDTINLAAGERLQMLATAKASGVAIVLDDTYLVDACLVGKSVDFPAASLAPTITIAGKISIDYDTLNLEPGKYLMDIRISKPAGHDQWSRKIPITIGDPITPPSARS